MADNVQITEGSGTAVHADEYTDSTYGAGKSQQVKIADATPGSSNKLIVGTGGSAQVHGEAAENAAAAGNPVLTGGRYDASDRVLADGDVGALAVTPEGILKTSSRDANGDAVTPIPQAVFTPRQVVLNFSANIDSHVSGDVVADRELLAAVTPANDVSAVLTSMTVVDISDTAPDLRFHFLKADVSLGTESSPVSLSAANAVNHIGYVDVVAADYADLINSQVATVENINLGILPVSGTDDVYVAIEARGDVDLVATTDLHVTFSFL